MQVKQLTEARYQGGRIHMDAYMLYDKRTNRFVFEISRTGAVYVDKLVDQNRFHNAWLVFSTPQEATDYVEEIKQISMDEYPQHAKEYVPLLEALQVVRLAAFPV